MFRKVVVFALPLVINTGLDSSEGVEIKCESTPQSVALCTIMNLSSDDLILLVNDGSLEGPVPGEDYVFLSIGADRFESVLQYGPADRPLWKGNHIHPSVCITPERLSGAVILPSGADAAITLNVSTPEVESRLRGHFWRMKFKTVVATRTSLKRIVGELGGDWATAFSGVEDIAKDTRLVLPSGEVPRRPICSDDESAISDGFVHLESPPFEVRRFGSAEE